MSKNHIEQAYEEGKRIRLKDWLKVLWIKKHSSEQSINSIGAYHLNDDWTFYEYPEQWEIWHEDVETETPTQPKTPTNPILEAFHAGKRVRLKNWNKNDWTKKYSETQSITESGKIFNSTCWSFDTKPEQWEIWLNDIETLPQPEGIQQAIHLLKANGYEVYKIEKIKQ
jgi:hypothetical protein